MNIMNNIYNGPTLSVTISREGSRIHQLVDDTMYPRRIRKVEVRRDPMVEALFGAAGRQVAQAASKLVKQVKQAKEAKQAKQAKRSAG